MHHHFYHLSNFRRSAELTQSELANRLHVGQPNIARLEKNPETISLQQLESWLNACGLISNVQRELAEFSGEISKHLSLLQLATGIEEVLRAKEIELDIKKKPLFAICSNELSDHELLKIFVRSLLYYGDKLFFGYYTPCKHSTILWKHISERPYAMTDTVYSFDGVLKPWMRNNPSKFLNIVDKGNLLVASEYNSDGQLKTNNSTIVIYFDHPLLQCFDLIQIPQETTDLQSLYNLQMVAEAELTALCLQGNRISHSALLTCAAAGKKFDFIACPAGGMTEEVKHCLSNLYGYRNETKVFNLKHMASGWYIQNTEAVSFLSTLSMKCLEKMNGRIRQTLGLTDEYSGCFVSRTAPSIDNDSSQREFSLLSLLRAISLNYPLSLEVLVRIVSISQVLAHPRFNSLSEMSSLHLETIDTKALDIAHRLLAKLDIQNDFTSEKMIPESILKLIQIIVSEPVI